MLVFKEKKKKKLMANAAHAVAFGVAVYKSSGRRRLLALKGSAGETISQITVPDPLQHEQSGPCITRMTAASA